MAMTNSSSREDYIKDIKRDYARACHNKDKKTKTTILDEAIKRTGLHRKYLITMLGSYQRARPDVFGIHDRRGRKPKYSSPDFMSALLICWRAANQSCAENLTPYLPELIPQLKRCNELRVDDEVQALLLKVSISTIARRLKKHQTKDRIPLSTTRPSKLLKSQVAVRRGRWDESSPGSLETDTVAHCGDLNAGTFIHSYNFVDIASSWSEQIAVMSIGERETVAAISLIRTRLPFEVVAIDSDNGGEFINYHLHKYCKNENINFTRSRPYKKNDNAHIEQKNNSAIRKIVGYSRYDTKEQLTLMNKLYQGPLRLYLNYCQPTRKRKLKTIDVKTGKVTKAYFEAKTPYQRITDSQTIDQQAKQMLQFEYNKLNPVQLLAEIQAILDELYKTLR